MIETIRLNTKKEIKSFIRVPHLIYRDDPNYVPSPYAFDKKLFNKKKNPFFRHSEAAFFIATKEGKLVGRIAAIMNNIHLDTWKDNYGFFGFLDTIDDYEVAKALLDQACEWVKGKGLSGIIGPESYTTNEVCGILTKGFEKPPYVLMPYNKEYYTGLLQQYGFRTLLGLKSYEFNEVNFRRMPDRVIKRLENRLEENGIKIRYLDFGRSMKDINKLRKAYNEAFQHNWGFVPLTKEEFREYAKNISRITKPEMILIAEHNKRVVGFLCAVYNINQLFIHIKNGRIFPGGILKYLKHKKEIDQARILIMGVIDEYRNKGIDVCLYNRITDVLLRNKIYRAEAAYVMDSNNIMQAIIEKWEVK